MLDEIKKLVKYKEELDELMEVVRTKTEEFEIGMAQLYQKVEQKRYAISATEETIREGAIMGYLLDMNKDRPYGIKIKELKEISYDTEKALKFAKEHSLFLKLDTKEFESYAKKSYDKEDEIKRFVTLTTKPKAFLPQKFKLSEDDEHV